MHVSVDESRGGKSGDSGEALPKEHLVRLALRSEEAALIEHCRMHHSENGIYGLPQESLMFDEDGVRNMIRRSYARDNCIIGVIGTPGNLEASICITISKLWHVKNWHLEELWTFVHPDCRKTRHVHKLGEFAKECSLKMDLPLIGGIITNTRTQSKMRLYRRMYGNPVGAYFVFSQQRDPEESRDEKEFWDNPFPRPGVHVIRANSLSKADLQQIGRLKAKSRTT